MKNREIELAGTQATVCASGKMSRMADKIKVGAASALLTLQMLPVYADMTVDEITVPDGLDANKVVGSILGIIMLIARFIGSAMLDLGLVMFGLAIKNDEPESKQKALMTAFAGIVLVALKSILQAAGIIS